ncbi:adenylyltransferase/cytidyltransferase family protein [Chryseobacterium salipaludis]|uniref:adenylyltransferase/cytidyltransferase family protein n=1 Tax=Chryseobacterium TaxID=59732 RepID=UPI001FF52741|nr:MULTISPECIES: adenylyltransferase/cytidyltransferase family protein [Chryseobacterium]MCJ8496711.1 adenylyltransferase/cytidyltransferase family protein [Chryseobacterium salipaludis]MCX3296192.1 adenylyltransferase/cytidyltransferase family protein [Planobacterium sp. JC490]
MENCNKKKIGITFSCFDLLHAGHIRMLAEAKAQCDYLIVGLQTDPTIDRPEKNKPTQTVVERYIQLEACKYVDEIVPYTTEQDLEDILKLYQIDVRIIGDEYKDDNFTGREFCEEKNIALHYNERNHRFSSSGLRRTVYEMEHEKLKNATEEKGMMRKLAKN